MFSKKLSLLVLPLIATFSLHANDPFNDPFFNDPFGDDIFKEMMQMQKDMDKMFNRMHQRIQQRSSGLVSPLGTYKIAGQNQLVDKGSYYEFLTNIPESKENHIDINTANGVMSVTAKIIRVQENKTTNSVSQSRSVRMYQQSTTLPNDADEGSIKTSYKNGMLVITIEKKNVGKRQNKPEKEEKKIEDTNKTKESNTTIKKTTLSDKISMS
jgi:HSP20 family protein